MKRFREELRELRNAPPGHRFEAGFERMSVSNHLARLVLITVGLALMVVAAVTFFIPGPNFVLVLAGLALVGGQSRTVARGMDWIEVRSRRWHEHRWSPYPYKSWAIVVACLVLLALFAVPTFVAWRMGWLPAWLPGIA